MGEVKEGVHHLQDSHHYKSCPNEVVTHQVSDMDPEVNWVFGKRAQPSADVTTVKLELKLEEWRTIDLDRSWEHMEKTETETEMDLSMRWLWTII